MTKLYGREELIIELRRHASWLAETLTTKDGKADFVRGNVDSVRVILLYGPPGIGKTTLLGAFYSELYRLSKETCDKISLSEEKRGFPYSSSLEDSSQNIGLSGALNPSVEEGNQGAGFFWIGARFDNPNYRQYRPFSLADSLRLLQTRTEEFNKNNKSGQKLAKSLVSKVLNKILPVEAIKETAGLALELFEYADVRLEIEKKIGGIKEIKSLARKASNLAYKTVGLHIGSSSENEVTGRALGAMNHCLPMVIALDNMHWACQDGGESTELNSVIELEKTIRESKADLFGTHLPDLFKNRCRLLYIVTLDAAEYLKIKDQVTQVASETTQFSGDIPSPDDHPLLRLARCGQVAPIEMKIPWLNATYSEELFITSYYDEIKINSQPKKDKWVLKEYYADLISGAGGLPLRLVEMARLVARGIEPIGPLEAEFLHYQRLVQLMAGKFGTASVLRKTLLGTAILARGSGAFSEKILVSCIEEINLDPLIQGGFITQTEGFDGDRWVFTQPEYPFQICGMDEHHDVEAVIVDSLSEAASRSFREYPDGPLGKDSANSTGWLGILGHSGRQPIMDDVAIFKVIADFLLINGSPSTGRSVKLDADRLALWALSVFHVCNAHQQNGHFHQLASYWRQSADVIAWRLQVKDRELSVDNARTRMSPVHYICWTKFFHIANSGIDLREGLDGAGRTGSEPSNFMLETMQRLYLFKLVAQWLALGDPATPGKHMIFLEVITHWAKTMRKLKSRELNRNEIIFWEREMLPHMTLTPQQLIEDGLLVPLGYPLKHSFGNFVLHCILALRDLIRRNENILSESQSSSFDELCKYYEREINEFAPSGNISLEKLASIGSNRLIIYTEPTGA